MIMLAPKCFVEGTKTEIRIKGLRCLLVGAAAPVQ